MALSQKSYEDTKIYPQNVPDRTLAPYALNDIGNRLNTHSPRLFTDEGHAALDFLDLRDSAQGTLNLISST